MGDASAVAGAAKWIGTALIQEAKYLYGVEDDVCGLQRELEYMQEFLQRVDANPTLVREDGQLLILTKHIRELAFRAEDAIATYIVDVESKVQRKSLFLKVACLASSSYLVHMLRKEIDSIQQEIMKAKERSESYRNAMSNTNSKQEGSNVGSSSSPPIPVNNLHLCHDEVVVGIEDDIAHLVKRLTNPEDDFKVLGIIGTGGGGKTTLATQLYRHSRVKSWFSHRAFVSVSQQWSGIDLLDRIFKQFMGDQVGIPSNESELVEKLQALMKDKRCLLVLDDIWKKDAWDDIQSIIPSTKGYRVILTTRIEEVPLYADTRHVLHEPQPLNDDQKWALFSKVAMEGREGIENNVEFEILGKQMLEKCQGLPLAVVTLGGILRRKRRLNEWESISKAWKDLILKEKGGSTYGVVEDMLELSYLDLPTHLKPCFLYLGIIPEDKNFQSDVITQMWIAEGFITNDQQMRYETLEDAAMRLLDELAQRCVLQVTKRNLRGQIEEIRMHDLMREFCINKANDCHFLETVCSTRSDVRRSTQARRISISFRVYYPLKNHHLRTLVYHGVLFDKGPRVLRNLKSIHIEFRLLRVLSTRCVKIDALPKQIGSLVHLTYLSLVDTEIRELPKSIRNLRNLMYLEYVSSNYYEVQIPNDLVGKMENLRALILPDKLKCGSIFNNLNTLGLKSGSKQLHSLTCGAGRWMTEELTTLCTPLLNLHISRIKEIEEAEAMYGCLSISKGTLCTLTCSFMDEKRQDLKFDMEKLSDCQTLWSLHLDSPLTNNVGTIAQFPPNLVSLTLCNSRIGELGDDTNFMEILGQLSKLKFLFLDLYAYLGRQLSCAGTAFPQLQVLKLQGLKNLEEWRMEDRAMDGLNKLEINYCTKMKRLPERIRSITTLKELVIRFASEGFCRRLGYDEDGGSVEGGGQDSYIIQRIPSVRVSTTTW